MSFGSRIRELKDSILLRGLSDPNHWLARIVGNGTAASGQNVTIDSALRVSAVQSCVGLLSESVASLPVMLYERAGEKEKRPLPDDPLCDIIRNAPNDFQDSFEWTECNVARKYLNGNAINQKVMTGSGKLKQLLPLNPQKMVLERSGGTLIYKYTHEDGKTEDFPASKIWHVRNMPISTIYNGNIPDGLWGNSTISMARESIGLSLSADDYGGRFFSNMASVGLNAKFPAGVTLSDNARNFLKESLAEYAKPENKFKSIITENGGELVKMGLSNEDSQFLESRQFQIEEIARVFRVPPVLIGHPTNTMTFASAEQIVLAFTIFTLRPLTIRLERSMNRFLLNEKQRRTMFFEYNLSGLLRGDIKTRYEAFKAAREWGWLNVDEIRAYENENPLPDGKGKIYLQPLNMKEAGTKDPELVPTTPEPKAGGKEDEAGT